MKNSKSQSDTQTAGLTVKKYAEAKQLPLEFLRKQCITQISILGRPAVKIPYFDENFEEAAVQFRHSLNKDTQRFSWRKGSKPCPYGMWRLKKARDAGYIVIAEGPSDCHTLWLHGVPAIGVPGANSWKEEWAQYFDGIDDILLLVEPDKGGDAMLAWARKSAIHERVQVVQLDGAKDPSELYMKNPDRFLKRWHTAVAAAIPLHEIEADEKSAEAKAAWKQCKKLATNEDILECFSEELTKRGATGISRIAEILYLAITSRFLERIVSVGLKGPSSGGKSFALQSVLDFFPKDAFYELTALSDKALAYSEEPLSNRIVVLSEAHALEGAWVSYFMRSLLSENRLVYETVEKTPDGLRSRRIERPGPTGLITTMTAVALHPETETRYLSLRVSDSRDQTQAIIQAQARKLTGETQATPPNDETLFTQWHALQAWLKHAEHRVVVPFAPVVGELIPPVAVRLRRDFPTVMSLVQAHALLHQASRERDSEGRIIATLEEDYGIVRYLVKVFMAEAAERAVPTTVRETVNAVSKIIEEMPFSAPGATIRGIADELEIDRSAAHRRVRESISRGFLISPDETKKGKITQLKLGDPLPEDAALLPSVKRVREHLEEIASGKEDNSESEA